MIPLKLSECGYVVSTREGNIKVMREKKRGNCGNEKSGILLGMIVAEVCVSYRNQHTHTHVDDAESKKYSR